MTDTAAFPAACPRCGDLTLQPDRCPGCGAQLTYSPRWKREHTPVPPSTDERLARILGGVPQPRAPKRRAAA